MRLSVRLRRACYQFPPCLLVAYNLGPLVVGFVGGLAAALLPFLAISLAAPSLVQHAIVVLANAAAGAAAGIAAATARRPASVSLEEITAVQHGDTLGVLSVMVVNRSSVPVRDLVVTVTGFEKPKEALSISWVRSGHIDTLIVSGRGLCCACRGCRVEASRMEHFKRPSMRLGIIGELLASRSTPPQRLPPGGIAEIPVLELEAIDFGGCLLWDDCSPAHTCGELGEVITSTRYWLLIRLLAGGREETIATYLLPPGAAKLTVTVSATGDPMPRVTEDFVIGLESHVHDKTLVVRVSWGMGSRRFYLRPLRCISHH